MKKAIDWILRILGALTLVGFFLVGVFSVLGTRKSAAPMSVELAGEENRYMHFAPPAPAQEPAAPPPADAAPSGVPRPKRAAPSKAAHGIGDFATAFGGGRGIGNGNLGFLGGNDEGEKKKGKEDKDGDGQGPGGGGEGGAPAATREWFPESFLFDPLVVTSDQGTAEVTAKVPDRLTRWRVLALAHSRGGLQAGTVTDFQGTLPAYVEPVVPPFLVAGDEVKLPVQVVNTTPSPLSDALHLEATGAQLASAGGKLDVPASSSKVQYVGLSAPRTGEVNLKAAFGSTDAVARTFAVRPNGKPVDQSFGGTLAAPRELTITAPANALPDSGKVRLAVFPGALAVLRSELTGASSRSGPDADAYALLLAGKGPALLQALGEKADADVVRAMTLVSTQRAFQWARTPALSVAVAFAEASLAHPESPVLARLGERLAAQAARAQRPDGTFSGANGWTVQRLLVATADGLRAVRAGSVDSATKQRAEAASVKASGAFERNLKLVLDAYTAAVILDSGGVTGSVADTLRGRVRDAVVQDADGSRYLPVESQTLRADGVAPSVLQATALAALALQNDEKAPWRADLGAYVLSRYRPEYGWGDGQTNLACLRAVLALFKDPLPPKIEVVLELDGKRMTSGTLSGERLKDVLALESDVGRAAGEHHWTVKAEPAVPGLGYALSLRVYVPWTKSENQSGFEMTLNAPAKLKVGLPSDVDVKAVAPSGVASRIRQSLPAGVQADRASLEKLKADGAVTDFEVEDGFIELDVPARQPGEVFAARYRVIPTLAGTLHASASTIAPQDRPELAYELPPQVWTVQ